MVMGEFTVLSDTSPSNQSLNLLQLSDGSIMRLWSMHTLTEPQNQNSSTSISPAMYRIDQMTGLHWIFKNINKSGSLQSCKVQQDLHFMTVYYFMCFRQWHSRYLILLNQTQNIDEAQIYFDPNGRQSSLPDSCDRRGCDRLNLPSFPRDSSSFWIWFSKKNMATAKASSARSCNLGGIMTLSSPIKSSRQRYWSVHAQAGRHWKRTRLQSGWVCMHGPVFFCVLVWISTTVQIISLTQTRYGDVLVDNSIRLILEIRPP